MKNSVKNNKRKESWHGIEFINSMVSEIYFTEMLEQKINYLVSWINNVKKICIVWPNV